MVGLQQRQRMTVTSAGQYSSRRCFFILFRGPENNKNDGLHRKDYSMEKKVTYRVSMISIAVNVLLSAGKLVAGIVGASGAMVSDAVHSLSDVFSTFIVMIGVTISGRQSDSGHQYGHERMECVASILLAVVLFATGVMIGWGGLNKIVSGDYGIIVIPGMLALIAAGVSIVVKEWMFWYTRASAKKINSGALMADAWHHRSDALSSVGALVGIAFARCGYPIMDAVASLIICVFVAKAAIDIFRDAIDKMVDKACDDETVDAIRNTILQVEGVQAIDELQTRLFGNKIYVDVEICADGELKLTEAHEIAENVHLAIENTYPLVKHCMVHVNPNLSKTDYIKE